MSGTISQIGTGSPRTGLTHEDLSRISIPAEKGLDIMLTDPRNADWRLRRVGGVPCNDTCTITTTGCPVLAKDLEAEGRNPSEPTETEKKLRMENCVNLLFRKHFEQESNAKNQALMTDQKTGLLNEKAIRRDLFNLLSSQNDNSVTIFFFDLNKFKKFNDSYNHDAGDQVLKLIGSRLKNKLRSPNLRPYRKHGDEFVVIAHDKFTPGYVDEVDTLNEGRRIVIQDIVAAPYTINGDVERIGTSVGYYRVTPQDKRDFQGLATPEEREEFIIGLISEADRRMYQEKHGTQKPMGREQAVFVVREHPEA